MDFEVVNPTTVFTPYLVHRPERKVTDFDLMEEVTRE
jgi:hypothetical protein